MTDVQPTGGEAADSQGSESQGSIFDPYLQSVPDGWDSAPQGTPREIVSQYLKDAEKNVNTRLSEAADLQKRFGDYKDIDLSRVQPQQLSQVLDWYSQVGASPEAYQEWLKEAATEAGLIQAQQEETPPAENQDIEAYIQSRIEQALSPIQKQLGERDQAAQQEQMAQHIVSTLQKLETENKIKLTDEQQEAVLALGESVQGDDWIEKGFAKYQALTGQAQANLVADKSGQPAPPLRTGGQAAAAKPKSFVDVREAALELMNQAL